MKMILAVPLFMLIAALSACGGSAINDRATTGSGSESIDTYSDLPRFGDLPTDAVLRPGPLSTEEIAEVLSVRRKAGDFMVECMNENGWNTTLEKDFPDYLSDFVYSPEVPPWPSDRLIRLNDPNYVPGITGGITEESTIEDAINHLEYLNENRPDLFQLSKSSNGLKGTVPQAEKEKTESEQSFSASVTGCLMRAYVEDPTPKSRIPEKVQETVAKIKADGEYYSLVEPFHHMACFEEHGIDLTQNLAQVIVAPLKEWVDTGIKPDIKSMHDYERAYEIADAECENRDFRKIREIEVRYNRDAGLI